MGADFYIRSLSEPAEKRYRPKFNAAVRKRDQYYDQRVAELVAGGQSKDEAEWQVRQEPRYGRLQARVTQLWDELYSAENGYFRDGYNHTNLFTMFGLGDFRMFTPGENQRASMLDVLASVHARLSDNSTWQVFQRLVDKDGLLVPDKAKVLLQILQAHEPVFYSRLDNLIEYWRQALGRELTNEDSHGWAQYFDIKYETFRRFLQQAIELDEAILVSY